MTKTRTMLPNDLVMQAAPLWAPDLDPEAAALVRMGECAVLIWAGRDPMAEGPPLSAPDQF